MEKYLKNTIAFIALLLNLEFGYAQKGALIISTEESGAKVYINGKYSGITPLDILLSYGTYNLKVKSESNIYISKEGETKIKISEAKIYRLDILLNSNISQYNRENYKLLLSETESKLNKLLESDGRGVSITITSESIGRSFKNKEFTLYTYLKDFDYFKIDNMGEYNGNTYIRDLNCLYTCKSRDCDDTRSVRSYYFEHNDPKKVEHESGYTDNDYGLFCFISKDKAQSAVKILNEFIKVHAYHK